MQFQLYQPCRGSASFCGMRVLASGVIDPEAPARLAALVGSLNYSPTIVFDSPGGSLAAGIQMGEFIRSNGLDTVMEPTYIAEQPDQPFAVLAEKPMCYSACAYAFMGGVSRSVAEGARIGVHQFRGAARETGEATAQTTVTVLSQYMKRMGIDRDVLDVAGLTESASMQELSRTEAQAYNLDNTKPPLAAWELKALETGDLMLGVRQQKAGGDARTLIAVVRDGANPDALRVVVGLDSMGQPLRDGYEQVSKYANDAELCGVELCAPLKLVSAWTKGAGTIGLTATYAVSRDALAQVVAGNGPLEFNSGFANAAAVDPSVTLGSVGLSNGFRALLRN